MSRFACPACGGRLERRGPVYRCAGGHSYDVAAEGYVYLLPPNKKHSRMPGDDRQMVASRRRFLEGGWYADFSDTLNRLAAECLAGSGKSPVILDAGCGEGYYTGRLTRFLEKNGLSPEGYGFDISKSAVKAAAKKCGGISFAVGSMFGIPFRSGEADLLTDVFAPIVPEEFLRVVRPGGHLILAVPGARHLYGMKRILYDEPYENETRDTQYPGFEFLRRVPVRGEITTEDPQVMRDLFAMTPYYWKTPKEGCGRLERALSLKTETGFDFLIYRKAADL